MTLSKRRSGKTNSRRYRLSPEALLKCCTNNLDADFATLPPKNRDDRCSQLLSLMARRAPGTHRKRLEELAFRDLNSGIRLLEELRADLSSTQQSQASLVLRAYINTSDAAALGELERALAS